LAEKKTRALKGDLLFGVCERSVESSPDNGQVLRHLLIVDVVPLLVDVLGDLLVEGRVSNGGHAAHAHLGDGTLRSGAEELTRQHCESGVRLLL
jgi:hypothetical protein